MSSLLRAMMGPHMRCWERSVTCASGLSLQSSSNSDTPKPPSCRPGNCSSAQCATCVPCCQSLACSVRWAGATLQRESCT